MAEANKTVREISKELRQERIRLMQELAGGDGQAVQIQDYGKSFYRKQNFYLSLINFNKFHQDKYNREI